jgi:hypothetical protein
MNVMNLMNLQTITFMADNSAQTAKSPHAFRINLSRMMRAMTGAAGRAGGR